MTEGARLGYVFLDVRDLPASLAFYRDRLGLAVEFEQPGNCAFLAFPGGGARLALYAERTSPAEQGGHVLLAIDVADLETARDLALSRGIAMGQIETVPGGRISRFEDPDGNRWELHEARA